DGHHGNSDGDGLGAAELFGQQHHADGDADQRIDEIVETNLEDLLVAHGPDEDQPVDGDQNGRDAHQKNGASVPERHADLAELLAYEQDGSNDNQRAQDAIGHDPDRNDMLDELEEHRQHAPERVGGERGG